MVTPDEVLKYKYPTQGFLCPLSANIYGIDFLEFQIRDMDNRKTIFHVKRDKEAEVAAGISFEDADDSVRFIQYDFGAEFLKLKTIGTSLVFSVGAKEVPSFRMIERHYFRSKLLKSFDFTFGFCIPNSTNSWEVIYSVPELSKKEVQEMIGHPFETKSDSFYFVNNELIMHHKAEYAYTQHWHSYQAWMHD